MDIKLFIKIDIGVKFCYTYFMDRLYKTLWNCMSPGPFFI